ncbi:MAG: FkbM family methyltransferase [Bacteroidota bacterium]
MKHIPGIVSPYSDRIKHYLMKEVFEEEIYRFSTANAKPLIIDCGANTGLSALYFHENFPAGRIIAFEPDPLCYGLLEQHIVNREMNNVEAINCAVSNFAGTARFFTHSEITGQSTPVMSLQKNEATDQVIEVACVHFGEYIKQFDQVDFCKVDIEGGESALLQGLVSAGSVSLVSEFVVEYHVWAAQLYDAETFVSVFESQGFTSSLIKSEPAVEGWPASGNHVFRFTRSSPIKP